MGVPIAAISFINCPLELLLAFDSSFVVSHIEGGLSTTTVMYYAGTVVVKKNPQHPKTFSSETDPRKNPNGSSMSISCQKTEYEIFLKQIKESAVGLGSSFTIHVIRLSPRADNRGGLHRSRLVFQRCIPLMGGLSQDNLFSNLTMMSSFLSLFPGTHFPANPNATVVLCVPLHVRAHMHELQG